MLQTILNVLGSLSKAILSIIGLFRKSPVEAREDAAEDVLKRREKPVVDEDGTKRPREGSWGGI